MLRMIRRSKTNKIISNQFMKVMISFIKNGIDNIFSNIKSVYIWSIKFLNIVEKPILLKDE